MASVPLVVGNLPVGVIRCPKTCKSCEKKAHLQSRYTCNFGQEWITVLYQCVQTACSVLFFCKEDQCSSLCIPRPHIVKIQKSLSLGMNHYFPGGIVIGTKIVRMRKMLK